MANGLWLGADVTGIVDWFVEHRLPDGGWNCEWVEGSTRSSFHSTLNALKGLLDYDVATGGTDATRAARHSGEEYLLSRDLFRRLSTGEPVAPWVDHFAYPMRWRYTVLNAADYFRRGSLARRHGAGSAHGRGDRTRSAPPGSPTAPGCRERRYRGGCGSRSTSRLVNRRSG